MLKIHVHENGECLLEKRVPDEFGDLGCVFLLQETFVATLALGGSVECGTFRVSLVSGDSISQEDAVDESRKSDLSIAETTAGTTTSQRVPDETCVHSDDELTTVSDEPARPISVTLEVYPRIPGFDLRAIIGRGGMGLVWKAVQLSTNRMVAVKTIHPRMLGDPKSQHVRSNRLGSFPSMLPPASESATEIPHTIRSSTRKAGRWSDSIWQPTRTKDD